MNTQKIEKWCEKNLTNIKIAFNGKHYVTVPNFKFGDLGAGAHETVGEFEGKLWWCVYVSETIGTVLTEMVELTKEQIEA